MTMMIYDDHDDVVDDDDDDKNIYLVGMPASAVVKSVDRGVL